MSMTVEQAKQAVAEKLGYKSWLEYKESADIFFMGEIDAYHDVCELFFAELEKHRWIPIEEKLPEKGGEYIVAKKNGLVCQMTYQEAFEVLKPIFYYHGLDQTSQVTHWRYLPEVP